MSTQPPTVSLSPGQLQQKRCADEHLDFEYANDTTYCNSFYDSFLCWGPTPAGETAYQSCPVTRMSDATQQAFRVCGEMGQWLGRKTNETSANGWTNFTQCFPAEVRNVLSQLSNVDAQSKYEIARNTRYIELFGYTVSLITLVLSLVVFSYFRALRNSRTKIHMSLFAAMILQVSVRLVLYADQEFYRHSQGDDGYYSWRGINSVAHLCELAYVILEYANTVTFLWMFLEGMFLNNQVNSKALRRNESLLVYFVIGWGLPLVVTIIWAVFTALNYQNDSANTCLYAGYDPRVVTILGLNQRCWFGYNFDPTYWIIQGPRLATVVANIIFLINIVKQLVIKLRQNDMHSARSVRKAVRAAFLLVPLLGVTNALDMYQPPLNGSVTGFAVWSYLTHSLRSFQGLFLSVLYCFLNAEVQTIVKQNYRNRMAIRESRQRNASYYSSTMPTTRPVGLTLLSTPTSSAQHWWEAGQYTFRARSRSEGTQTRLDLINMQWSTPERRQYQETTLSMPIMTDHRRTQTRPVDTPRLGHRRLVTMQTTATVEHERCSSAVAGTSGSLRGSRSPEPLSPATIKRVLEEYHDLITSDRSDFSIEAIKAMQRNYQKKKKKQSASSSISNLNNENRPSTSKDKDSDADQSDTITEMRAELGNHSESDGSTIGECRSIEVDRRRKSGSDNSTTSSTRRVWFADEEPPPFT